MRVLGYADDASLLEPKVQDMSKRLTSLADGAEADADMKVSIKKTFTQHVGKRDDIKISKEEAAAAQDSFSHKCDFCNRKFNSRKAMLLHRNSCIHQYNTTEEVFTVEDIVGVFGWLENRWLLVKWEGYEEPDWQPEHLLRRDGCHDAIREFWCKNGLDPGKIFYQDNDHHRCDVCARSYRRKQDLKAHKTRTGHHYLQQRSKVTPSAVAKATLHKRIELQKELPMVAWGEQKVENNWQFKYLGALFEAGGSHLPDVARRIAMARQRFGKMRHIWTCKVLHLRLRLRLYIASVCSILTYGSEAWNLTAEVRRKINGANSQMLSVITGKTQREEASETTCSFNLVRAVRARRLQWLGHILRLHEDRILLRAVKHVYDNRNDGDILSDAPETSSWDELRKWAADRDKWRSRVSTTRSKIRVTVKTGVFVPESTFSFTVSS